MLTWPWPLLVLLSFATTCTMGDDSSWAFAWFYSTCITALALPLLIVSAGQPANAHARLSVVFLTVVPLLLVLPHAVETGFGTHSLCGPDYDEYAFWVDPNDFLTRWYYRLMWSYALALSAAAAWPWWRSRTGTDATATTRAA